VALAGRGGGGIHDCTQDYGPATFAVPGDL
jgi:hypothetical protein